MKLADKEKTLTIEQILRNRSSAIDKELDAVLPPDTSLLTRAMRYSCIELKGKKLRPFIFLEIAKILSIDTQEVMKIAAAIELVHVYSLIHDDLPSMDNDDLRRGQPSCHKKFTEATALLAGNALLSLAFEVISECNTIPKDKRLLIISELAKAVGHDGMIKGQHLDIESQGKQLLLEEILFLYQLKTGKLINFACKAAVIIAPNCSGEARASIDAFADNFSLLFQITDDMLDFTKSTDKECNIVRMLGMKETQKLLNALVHKATSALNMFDMKAETLTELLSFVLNRES